MNQRSSEWTIRQSCTGCYALVVSALLLGGVFMADATPPGGSASWPKTFYDEFTGTSIDGTKWGYGTLPWSSGRYHKAEYSSYISGSPDSRTPLDHRTDFGFRPAQKG